MKVSLKHETLSQQLARNEIYEQNLVLSVKAKFS